MNIDDLAIAPELKQRYRQEGISELYPPQAEAVKAGLLDGKNLVLATPTASGKTLVAELAMAKALAAGRQAVYLVPLRALAYEKYREFKKFEDLGYRVAIEMGDLDSAKNRGRIAADIVVATAEKCDSLLRAKKPVFGDVGILVVDEVHLLTTDRGPVYEILVTRFRNRFPDVHVLALSATIGNADELAAWLAAELVSSTWRPVSLQESAECAKDKRQGLREAVNRALEDGGQALVFVASRRSAEAVAEELAAGEEEAKNLDERQETVADAAEHALATPTRQCTRLARCIRGGTAFHHAGLVNEQRIACEDAFKDGTIKVVAATPTLAAGVNLPARTVVIRDLKRYGAEGAAYIPVLDYRQMAGRAGRPRYDSKGFVKVLAKSDSEKAFVEEHYFAGEVEAIVSRLGVRPVLRFHVLSSVAANACRTEQALLDFFAATFFGHQYGIEEAFASLISEVVEELVGWDLLWRQKGFLLPTAIGSRVAELYIDPLTAKTYLDWLAALDEADDVADIGLLDILCDAVEVQPYLYVPASRERQVWEELFVREDGFLRDVSGFGADWQLLPRFATAMVFADWLSEVPEADILERRNIAPGLLYAKLRNLEWLVYAARELAGIRKLRNAKKRLSDLEIRIRTGVKAELLPLVAIPGIGRVRARSLFRAGYTRPADLRKAPLGALEPILGKKTAYKVKSNLS